LGSRRASGTVVDATLRAGSGRRLLARVSSRARFGVANAFADFVALVCAALLVDAVGLLVFPGTVSSTIQALPGWFFAACVAVVLSTYYLSGLYESEAFVSRPLHLWLLLKATLIAFAIMALLVYAFGLASISGSFVFLLTTSVAFAALACVLRFGVLDGVRGAWMRKRKPVSVLVGEPDATQRLTNRLGQLRGFERVERVASSELCPDVNAALGAMLDECRSAGSQAASVFVDAGGMSPRDVYKTAAAAHASGAEVYLVAGPFSAAEGNRLLGRLFDVPAIRLRRAMEDAKPYPLKRAMDIVGSAVLLLVFAPVIAVLGILIRLSSPGPVFYKQTRIGRDGVPFEFLKLRSMVTNGDVCIHADYVRAFMNGTAEAVATGVGGEAIFKKVDDPRITPVGRFVRKYSLDELPQFWNVFRGEMSLVGPRPPLPYEVDEYDDWDSLRLVVPAGITGLWQVEGRSRVTFDEMILQDLVYAQNMGLLVDIGLCLKTLPATLLGGGGG
jgi:exopolysaccharide biosynthesis polyprenyl glycosylphosphotransferase